MLFPRRGLQIAWRRLSSAYEASSIRHCSTPSESKGEKLLAALRNKKVTSDFALENIEAWVNPVGSADTRSGSLNDAMTVFREMLREENLISASKRVDRLGTTYSYLMHSLLKSDNDVEDFADRLASASELRAGMARFLQLRNEHRKIQLSAAALSANMLFLCKTGKLQEAHSILSSMMKKEDRGDTKLAPDLICFNIMMNGFASVGAVNDAKALIHLMIHRNKVGKSRMMPDIVSIQGVLQAYAKSNVPDAAEQAEAFLSEMQELTRIVPNTRCYTTLIDIHSKSRKIGSAKRAEAILRRMIMLEEQGHDIHVDAASFTAVIDALSKSEEPDALQKAGQMIDRMEELAAGGNFRLAPTVVTYNSFINVLAKSRNKGAGRTALGVLQRMKDHDGIEPTAISFNTVISALVHSGSDESDAVMCLLSQMKCSTNYKPTTITYNAVLHVLSQSHRGDAVQIAQSLLHEMQQDILTFPSTITYNTIMQIYAKRSLQDDAERIEEMLTYLEDNKELHPNKQSYTTAITAWARSQSPEKVQRASSILERMKAAYVSGNQTCEPDIIAYNALLNCCCFPIGRRDEAARVAMKAFSDIQESGYGPPDSITYSCTLQSLGRTMQAGDEKETWLKRVFDDACKDGLVNDVVLEQLSIASTSLFQKVVAENGGDRTRCPKAWSRRVNQRWVFQDNMSGFYKTG